MINGFCWEMMVKFTTFANSRTSGGIFDSRTSGGSLGLVLFFQSNDLRLFNGSNFTALAGTVNPMDGEWHHIAMQSRGGNVLEFYVDGIFRKSVNSIANAPCTGNFDMFRDVADGAVSGVRGYMDQIRVTKGAWRYNPTGQFTAFPTHG
jgi:hypothetical protein